MKIVRYLPWMALILAAWLVGAAGPHEWWAVPAIMVAAFAVTMIFIRLGVHRIR